MSVYTWPGVWQLRRRIKEWRHITAKELIFACGIQSKFKRKTFNSMVTFVHETTGVEILIVVEQIIEQLVAYGNLHYIFKQVMDKAPFKPHRKGR